MELEMGLGLATPRLGQVSLPAPGAGIVVFYSCIVKTQSQGFPLPLLPFSAGQVVARKLDHQNIRIEIESYTFIFFNIVVFAR